MRSAQCVVPDICARSAGARTEAEGQLALSGRIAKSTTAPHRRTSTASFGRECRTEAITSSTAMRSAPAIAARRPMRLCMCPSPAPHSRQVGHILRRQNLGTQRAVGKRADALHSCIMGQVTHRSRCSLCTPATASRCDQRIGCDKFGITSRAIVKTFAGNERRIRSAPALPGDRDLEYSFVRLGGRDFEASI
jgi:hypothetical protein